MIEGILTDNGLSRKEATLYLSVLEAGEMTLGRAAEKSRLKRSTVYSLADDMKQRGLVSIVKRKGITYISALSPRLLIDRFDRNAAMAKSVLPQLMDMAYASPIKPRIRFYEGVDGLCEILFDAASESTEDYIGFTDYAKMPKELYRFIRKRVAPEREKNGVILRLIVPHNDVNVRIRHEYQHQVEHRIVDFPSRKNHIEILLYEKSKIGFLSFNQSEMFGVVIDSEGIYKTLHDLFMLIWQNAK